MSRDEGAPCGYCKISQRNESQTPTQVTSTRDVRLLGEHLLATETEVDFIPTMQYSAEHVSLKDEKSPSIAQANMYARI
jgi:hypothetical protein